MLSTLESTSPPCKRARTLDIADVACLVATQQTAAYPSPEKPSPSPVSLCGDVSSPSTTVEESPTSQDLFSQELLEEDSVIQCSLPQYLSHVYGGSIIGSSFPSSSSSSSSSSLSAVSGCGSALTTPGRDDSSIPPIEESQGFTVTGSSDQLKISIRDSNLDGPSSAIPESSANAESSPLLFDSPASLPESSPTHQTSCTTSSHTLHLSTTTDTPPLSHTVATKPPSLPPEEAKGTPGIGLVRQRPSRKRKASATKAHVEKYTCPPSCVSLAECAARKPESLVSILAIVLQVNPVMEVACKRGPLAGSTVPMASLLLADPTRSCLKLLLWREAACWVERIVAGDILLLKSIRLKRWQGETVGHTIMYSKVLNLHQPKKNLPSKFQKMVPAESLQCLIDWGVSRHGYLFRGSHPLPSSQRPVHFRTSDELGVESVVHFRGKLTAVVGERVLLFSDRPGKDVFLYLVSSSRVGGAWYRELGDGVGEVWELQYLSVSQEDTQGGCSLQVTSRSRLRRLCVESSDAQAIVQRFPFSSQTASVLTVESISDLLECKSSGIRKCRARATKFDFQLVGGGVLSLDLLSGLSGLELVSRLLQAVYVGCETCAKPLTQDENHVYCPCEECRMKTPGGHSTSTYCYRPLVVRLTDNSATLEVIANQVAVSKLLGSVEATELFRIKLAQNVPKSDAVRESAERLLSSGETDCWIINTVFAVDEFSFVESLTVSLVDWTAA